MKLKYETHIATLAAISEELKADTANPFHAEATERCNGLADSLRNAALHQAQTKIDADIANAVGATKPKA